MMDRQTQSDTISRVARSFYGLSILAYGVQQILINDFRPEIVPVFPAWAHQYMIFPIVTGIAFILVGLILTNIIKSSEVRKKQFAIALGFFFLFLILFFHLPFTLFISPHKATHVGVWAHCLKELAFSGGAFIVAGSLGKKAERGGHETWKGYLPSLGRLFFCTTMILFGYSHFLYTDFISPMVPEWFGSPRFWTYFAGGALIGAGMALILRVGIRPIAYLLAAMLFIWLLIIHIPRAIGNPYAGNGNAIVSAFDALMFCGIGLLIGSRKNTKPRKSN